MKTVFNLYLAISDEVCKNNAYTIIKEIKVNLILVTNGFFKKHFVPKKNIKLKNKVRNFYRDLEAGSQSILKRTHIKGYTFKITLCFSSFVVHCAVYDWLCHILFGFVRDALI